MSRHLSLRIAALFVLIATCAPSWASAQASDCKASFGLCTAREVEKRDDVDAETLLWAFIVNGAVDDIVRWNLAAQQKHAGFQLAYVLEDLRRLSPQQSLAAVTLAAAAFNGADPYADRAWRAVAGAFDKDAGVAMGAGLLLRGIGYDPWENLLRDPPGLAAIWRTVLTETPDDFDRLLDLGSSLWFYGPQSVEPIARQLVERAIALPNPTPEQLAEAASVLAGRFKEADAAQALMDAGGIHAKDKSLPAGDDLLAAAVALEAAEQGEPDAEITVVQEADIPGKQAEIAEARLWNGKYDAAGARIVAAHLVDEFPLFAVSGLEALRRAGATAELHDLADAWLQKARRMKATASKATEYFGVASDAYRFAGDREKAIAAAREGMPLIPLAIDFRYEDSTALPPRSSIPDLAERRRMAGQDNGTGIAPAIALFRAGAEKEALDSGYFSGLELLKEWDRSYADFDPNWIVDDTPKWLDVSISNIVDAGDAEFAGRVHDALARSPGSAEPMQLAILAAAAGNVDQVNRDIAASLASVDAPDRHPSDKQFTMLRTVMAWKVSQMLLTTQPPH